MKNKGSLGPGIHGKTGCERAESGRAGEREGDIEKILYICISRCLINIPMNVIKSHKELIVYQSAFKVSMEIFTVTKTFPKEEIYSLTSQILRSSRSVCANLAEAFRKRRYEKAFVSKLSDSEGEAAETQVWLDYSIECEYISKDIYRKLFEEYEKIIGMLVNMLKHPEKWSFGV
jgi:four helix bundle protein